MKKILLLLVVLCSCEMDPIEDIISLEESSSLTAKATTQRFVTDAMIRRWNKSGSVLHNTSGLSSFLVEGDDIQGAIEAASAAGGGIVILQHREYPVRDIIRMRSNVHIVGNGATLMVYKGRSVGVQFYRANKASIKNLTIKGAYGTPPPFTLRNLKPDFNTTLISISYAHHNIIDNVIVKNAGNHVLAIWRASHNTVKNSAFEGSWNKDGGHGYFKVIGEDNLFVRNSFQHLRHVAIYQKYAKWNVFYKNTIIQDINFHDADGGYNLIEDNVVFIPSGLGIEFNPFMGPWSYKHSPAGPKNVIYNNTAYDVREPTTFRRKDVIYTPVGYEWEDETFRIIEEQPASGRYYNLK